MHILTLRLTLLTGLISLLILPECFSQADSTKGKVFFEEGMTAFRESRDWEILKEKFTQGVPLLEKEGPWPTYIKMCRGLNKYYSDVKYDFDSILKYSEKFYEAQSAHVKTKDAKYYSAVSDMGALRIRQGAFNQALKLYQDVYDFYQENTSTKSGDFANLYHSLGLCYREKGDYDEAMRFYDRSIDLLKDSASYNLAEEYNLKAKLLEELRRYDEAIALYQKAIPMLDPAIARDQQMLIIFYQSLAKISYKQNKDDQVLSYLAKANTFQKLHNNLDIESNYFILSELYLRQKNYEQALGFQELYDQELKKILKTRKRHPSLMKSKQLRARIFAGMGELEKALELCQESLSLLSENWTHTQTRQNPVPAVINFPIYAIPVLKEKADYLYQLFQVTGKLEDLEASLETYKITNSLISGLRNDFQSKESVLLLSEMTNPSLEEALLVAYQLYDKTKEEKYLQDALSFMEQNKAALLQAYLQDVYAKGNMGIPEELQAEEASYSDQISDLKRMIFLFGKKDSLTEKEIARLKQQKADLFQLESQKKKFIATLEQDYPEYYRKKYENALVSLEDVQKKLQKEDLLIEYFWGEKQAFVLAIDAQKTHFLKLDIQSEKIEAINTFQNMLKERDQVLKEGFSSEYFTQFSRLSYAIYQEYIQGIISKFSGKERLIFIPDGLISYIPFEVLIQEEVKSELVNYSTLPYLVLQHDISYTYSATLFEKKAFLQNAKKKGTALSVAPAYQDTENWDSELLENLKDASTRSGFAPLKHNKAEAESIEQIWTGKALHTQYASEKSFKELADDYQIIHLAMHAFANDENSMFSGLVFRESKSPDSIIEEEEDGILYAQEIYDMHIGADLVVLSACDTGTGQLRKGEGILSLARAFAFAGVPSTAMSLWQADDETISQIMTSFHQYLKEGYTKSSAMRQAKLDFLESSDRTHPYFWAAFMTIGDDSPISGQTIPTWLYAMAIMAIISVGLIALKKRNNQS